MRPNIAQGVLNRLRASVQWPAFPSLAVTPSLLAPEAIDFAPQGNATDSIPSLTGVVTSPAPYQMVTITVHLNKAQAFANQWKAQIEQGPTALGDCVVRPDTSTLDPFSISNCAIIGIERMNFGGRDIGFVLNLTGAYNINDFLWDGA